MDVSALISYLFHYPPMPAAAYSDGLELDTALDADLLRLNLIPSTILLLRDSSEVRTGITTFSLSLDIFDLLIQLLLAYNNYAKIRHISSFQGLFQLTLSCYPYRIRQ